MQSSTLPRKANWFELFFDLAFVAALATITHHFTHDHPQWAVIKMLLPMGVLLMTWSQVTFLANRFECDDYIYRCMHFLTMFGVLLIAAGSEKIFYQDSATFFVGGLLAKLTLIFGYSRIRAEDGDDDFAIARKLRWYYAASLFLFCICFLVPYKIRIMIVAIAVLYDISVPWLLRAQLSKSQNQLELHHLPERFGLFILLMLGECVAAVASGMSKHPALGCLALGFFFLFLIFWFWWLYFDQFFETNAKIPFSKILKWEYAHYLFVFFLSLMGLGLHVLLSRHPSHYQLWIIEFALSTVLAFVILLYLRRIAKH